MKRSCAYTPPLPLQQKASVGSIRFARAVNQSFRTNQTRAHLLKNLSHKSIQFSEQNLIENSFNYLPHSLVTDWLLKL